MLERFLELSPVAGMAGAPEIRDDARAMQLEAVAFDVVRRFGALLIAPALFGELLLRGDVFAFPSTSHDSILRRTKLGGI